LANETYFAHPQALVESNSVGDGTRVWAFAHILPRAVIGRDCNICDHTFIENDVVIGDRVTVKCGVQIWDGITLEDDVFVGPNATFTNDRFPRSRMIPERFLRTTVKRGATIGANATILPGLTIGERAMIGAGAVVTRDVPPNAVLVGNPARIVAYDRASVSPRSGDGGRGDSEASVSPTKVTGVSLYRMKSVSDYRGMLSFGEIGSSIPFDVKRYFIVYGVPSKEIRGEHAHKTLHQFLLCVHGSCHVIADDSSNREEFVLDDPAIGIHLPPYVWGIQYKYSSDAVLLVFASDYYHADDYIREYATFEELCGKRP
jgi:acetyltransferase-like isoleucine patch superfamily enzyme/dTDP-4-dehydrorhamnose 3,5-epimerase-like enzyme